MQSSRVYIIAANSAAGERTSRGAFYIGVRSDWCDARVGLRSRGLREHIATARTDHPAARGSPVEDARCAQEPIYLPAGIQPHGVLIIIGDDLIVEQVSANIDVMLACSAASVCGAHVSAILGAAAAHIVQAAIREGDLVGFNPIGLRLDARGLSRDFECVLHRSVRRILIELQPIEPNAERAPLDFARFRTSNARLQGAADTAALITTAALEMQKLSGFDRAMVYRFDENWDAKVLAEATSGSDVSPAYIGLHFPASDIPEQARRLYLAHPFHLIVDVNYLPAALISANDRTGAPVDLSGSILRSVSPIHLEYLRNMGVRASMSVSIIMGDRLWGLIVCHHRQPRWLDYHTREACVLLSDTLAQLLRLQLEATALKQQLAALTLAESIAACVDQRDDLATGLLESATEISALFEAQGFVVQIGDRIERAGQVPADDAILGQIVAALDVACIDGVAICHELGPIVAQAGAYASGALLIALGAGTADYVLLLRAEVVRMVHLGGDVRSRVTETGGRLHPRESFAVWTQTIRGGCARWSAADVANATVLRQSLVECQYRAQERRQAEKLRMTAEALGESERALRQSRAFLDRAGKAAGVGAWEVDLRTGTHSWSDHTRRITGFDTEPSADDWFSLFAPEARPLITSAFERAVATGEGYDLELPLIRADGTRIWVRAACVVEFSDGLPIRLTGAFQDVTARVAERIELQEANDRVALATQSGGIGIYEWDLRSREVRWDTTIPRLYGLDPSTPVPDFSQWRSLIHPDDVTELEAAAMQAIAAGEPLEAEFRVVWPDRSVHHLRASGHVAYDSSGRATRFVGANWDVTEARRLAAHVAAQHELLRVTMQSIGDGIVTTDARGNITWLNPAAECMTGWSVAEARHVPTETVLKLVHEDSREPTESPITACLAQGTVVRLANHTVLISRGGNETAIADSAAPIKDEHGEMLGVVLVFHDVTEQRRLSGEASYRAAHDILTGLPNRAGFTERLHHALRTAHVDGSNVAVLFLDLNKFKAINDMFGHAAGDRMLRVAADRIAACVRGGDFVARLGGDEFVIISPDLSDGRDAEIVAKKIVEAVAEPIMIPDLPELQFGVSIGIAVYPNDALDPDTLLKHADLAMYQAKKLGRSGFSRFGAIDSRTAHHPPALERRIARGLERSEFVPYYQPIVDLHSGELTSMEALARWNHPRLGLLPPAQFIPMAEQSGAILRLGETILQSAIRQAGDWRTLERCGRLRVSVNVSPTQFASERFLRSLRACLTRDGIAPECLQLEITESVLIDNEDYVVRVLRELAEQGIRVAIDDFGTGYSSLSYLQRLPVHTLKIDKSFVRDLTSFDSSAAIVRAIIAMAHSLGMTVVAEGVETQDQLEMLRGEGCDSIQGYLIGRPLSSADATGFIKRFDVARSTDTAIGSIARSQV